MRGCQGVPTRQWGTQHPVFLGGRRVEVSPWTDLQPLRCPCTGDGDWVCEHRVGARRGPWPGPKPGGFGVHASAL